MTPLPAVATRRSYADPSGPVYETAEGYVRHIAPSAMPHFERLLASEFVRTATADGLLPEAQITTGTESVVTTAAVEPLTFPWEWSPQQFVAAARLTLELAQRAFADGYVLKDAQARNVVFRHGRPVFVDLGSFEPYAGERIWLARGQFDRQFLLPLLVFIHRGAAPAQSLLCHPDGLTPATAARLLGLRAWTGFTEIETCALARGGARTAPRQPAPARMGGDDAVERATFAALLRHAVALVDRVERKLRRSLATHWGQYGDGRFHYGNDELAQKKGWVAERLRELAPRRVIDIGANTGTFSLLAADAGADVIAVESDPGAHNALCRNVSDLGATVTPVLADFCSPTPPLGWLGREFAGFAERFEGRADLALALAVSHHIAVRGFGPDAFLDALARMTTRHLVVEFVDPSDEMFAGMLATRGLAAAPYDYESFMAAFSSRFSLLREAPIKGGKRRLLLGERRG